MKRKTLSFLADEREWDRLTGNLEYLCSTLNGESRPEKKPRQYFILLRDLLKRQVIDEVQSGMKGDKK